MQRKPTSVDVARRAGVSPTTVSFVLNNVTSIRISEETRQRVLDAARELDYHPNAAARSLARKRAFTIGLILSQSPDHLITDNFLPMVMRGIASVTSPAGFKLLVEAVEDVTHPEAYLRLAREAHIDGMILSGPRSDDEQLLKLRDEEFPLVLIGQLPGSNLPFVDVDNVNAARGAVEHLLSLGHHRIACITDRPLEFTAAADRLLGYRRALEAHGIAFNDQLVRIGDQWDTGFEAMRSLLASPERPSAVFVASDVVALGAMQAVKSAGLHIPQDIAMVGFDDIPLAAQVTPRLTTVRLPARELGMAAAQMVVDIIRNGTHAPSMLLKTKLIVRESCGAQSSRSTTRDRDQAKREENIG